MTIEDVINKVVDRLGAWEKAAPLVELLTPYRVAFVRMGEQSIDGFVDNITADDPQRHLDGKEQLRAAMSSTEASTLMYQKTVGMTLCFFTSVTIH